MPAMDPPPRDKLGGDPIEMAGLFEGDIAGVASANMAVGKSFKPGKSGPKVSMELYSSLASIKELPYVVYASVGLLCTTNYKWHSGYRCTIDLGGTSA